MRKLQRSSPVAEYANLIVRVVVRNCGSKESIAGTGVIQLSHGRLCPENGTSQSPTPHTSLRTDGGPNSDPPHAAQEENQAQSGWLMLAHGKLRHESGTAALARAGSWRAQACSATAQAAYSLLTLHPCVTQDQIRKKLCVRVDFT